MIFGWNYCAFSARIKGKSVKVLWPWPAGPSGRRSNSISARPVTVKIRWNNSGEVPV